MVEYVVTDNPQAKDWNSFIARVSPGNLMQSYEYGEVAKASNPHTNVIRLLASDRNGPVGLVQATYQRRFGFGYRLEIGDLCHGSSPVLLDTENKEQILKLLIADLERKGRRRRVPEALVSWSEKAGMHEVFADMGYSLIGSSNVYKVSLGKTSDDVFKNFAHNKRRNIKKAQAQCVEVVHGSSHDDLVSFYEMLEISGRRAGFTPHPFSHFNAYLETFRASDKVKIFFANLKGRHIAGVFVVVQGDIAHALAAGSRQEAWHVRPNDILHWKAMEWACENGVSCYNMGYVPEPTPTEGSPLWSLWRWKKEWKGQLERTLIYRKIYMPNLKKLFVAPYEKIFHPARRAD